MVFCLVVEPGFVHTPAARSNCSHFAACTIEQRGEARALTKPDAKHKGAAKIDGAIAALCGYAALAAAKRDDGVSVLFLGGDDEAAPAPLAANA